jgi:hypothetical protein
MDKQFSLDSENSIVHNIIDVRLNECDSPKLKEYTALFDKFKAFTFETQVTSEGFISACGTLL